MNVWKGASVLFLSGLLLRFLLRAILLHRVSAGAIALVQLKTARNEPLWPVIVRLKTRTIRPRIGTPKHAGAPRSKLGQGVFHWALVSKLFGEWIFIVIATFAGFCRRHVGSHG